MSSKRTAAHLPRIEWRLFERMRIRTGRLRRSSRRSHYIRPVSLENCRNLGLAESYTTSGVLQSNVFRSVDRFQIGNDFDAVRLQERRQDDFLPKGFLLF